MQPFDVRKRSVFLTLLLILNIIDICNPQYICFHVWLDTRTFTVYVCMCAVKRPSLPRLRQIYSKRTRSSSWYEVRWDEVGWDSDVTDSCGPGQCRVSMTARHVPPVIIRYTTFVDLLCNRIVLLPIRFRSRRPRHSSS